MSADSVEGIDSERLDELLRALAHPDRRRFLRVCLERMVSAGELAAESDLALASVSEHLKVLRKTGLLVLEKQGRFRNFGTDAELIRRVGAAVAELAGGKEGADGA